MKYEELLKLRAEQDKIYEQTSQALAGIGENLKSFMKGFDVEITSFAFTFNTVEQKHSIHPQETGLQTDFLLRVAPYSEDPKKFGVIQVGMLDTGTKKYVRGKAIPRGDKKLEDNVMVSRLIEYFQGEVDVFDAEILQ